MPVIYTHNMRLSSVAEITPNASQATTAHSNAVKAADEKYTVIFAAVLAASLRKNVREAISNLWAHQGVGAVDGTIHEAEGSALRVPLESDLVDQAAAQARLEEISKTYTERASRSVLEDMSAELKISFDVSNKLLTGVILGQGGMKITTAPSDLVHEMMTQLQRSYDQGEGIKEAAKGLRATGYTEAKGHAERIARTELIRASNASSLAMVQMTTSIRYKRWEATSDARTREWHAEADGQEVPIDQPFTVDGESLNYPGDPSGSGTNVINCRCTLGYTDELSINTIAGGGGMAAVETETEDETTVGAAWAGVIAQEGVDTGDGRRIEPGALEWRTLPLTLMSQKTTPEWGGHADAQIAGRIDSITRSGEDITGDGVFDAGEWGADTERLVREGMLKGISVDLAVDEVEVIPDPDVEDEIEAWFLGTLNILKGTILGATIVPFPAFENASIAIVAGAAMSMRNARREMIDGESKTVVSFFMPFAAAMDTTDPAEDTAVADAMNTMEDACAAMEAAMGVCMTACDALRNAIATDEAADGEA